MYRWALCNLSRLGSTGQRVCVAGDSAGGNLAAAVSLRCVMEVCVWGRHVGECGTVSQDTCFPLLDMVC